VGPTVNLNGLQKKSKNFPPLFVGLYRRVTASVMMGLFIMFIYTPHIIGRIILKGDVVRMRKKKYIQIFVLKT